MGILKNMLLLEQMSDKKIETKENKVSVGCERQSKRLRQKGPRSKRG